MKKKNEGRSGTISLRPVFKGAKSHGTADALKIPLELFLLRHLGEIGRFCELLLSSVLLFFGVFKVVAYEKLLRLSGSKRGVRLGIGTLGFIGARHGDGTGVVIAQRLNRGAQIVFERPFGLNLELLQIRMIRFNGDSYFQRIKRKLYV